MSHVYNPAFDSDDESIEAQTAFDLEGNPHIVYVSPYAGVCTSPPLGRARVSLIEYSGVTIHRDPIDIHRKSSHFPNMSGPGFWLLGEVRFHLLALLF